MMILRHNNSSSLYYLNIDLYTFHRNAHEAAPDLEHSDSLSWRNLKLDTLELCRREPLHFLKNALRVQLGCCVFEGLLGFCFSRVLSGQTQLVNPPKIITGKNQS
jgi:hypothetical protein